MPKNPREIVQGKPWGVWVRDAARAIIAATTPPRRYVMVQGGFFAFQAVASVELNNGTPFRFGNEELRWIFTMIERQSLRDVKRYPQLARDFERRRTAAARKQFNKETEQAQEKDLSGDSGIVVEGRFGRVH